IKRLLITCFASTEGATRPEHEIQLDFDGRTINKTKIIVSVRSDVAGWSDRALSELEEQVERTSLQDVPHRIALAFLVSSVAVFLLLLVLSSLHVSSAYAQADVLWLRTADIGRVAPIVEQNRQT